MVSPTNSGSRRFAPRTGRDVWTSSGPPGYLESIQSAGNVAAPLLAAASFALVALVLQSTTARWQDLALLLLIGAGLAQVFAVQSVVWTRRYMATPDELRQWFPDDFTDQGERPTQWLLNRQWINDRNARKWANRTRMCINAGISLLLAGVAVAVVPPGQIGPMRWAVVVVAWAGVAVEASWVIAAEVDEPARLGMVLRSAAICTSGGATAAAGFAVAAGTADGAPATGWAVALAVLAVPCWLAACTDARLRRGRVLLYSHLTGGREVAQAALAVLAPVVFGMAVSSVIGRLAAGRREMLSGLHPGVQNLLPKGVSLGAHHRAWSLCTAVPVAGGKELTKLLEESGQRLPQDGQPRLDQLQERLAHSPGCVVKVVDRDNSRTRFGYFVVYPLLADTVLRIRSGEIKAGRELSPADLAASPDKAAGWYIGVIWAPGPKWTRRCVIATLVDALAASGAGTAARPVFARPATGQGDSLMKRYGFAAIGKADGILVLGK